MKIISTALLILLVLTKVQAQDTTLWQGHYTGELKSESINGKTNFYPMELKIEAVDDNTYKWIIIYGKEGDSSRSERNYLLKRTDKENHFIIDEQNTILLDLNLINNSFYSIFEVQNNLMLVEYRLSENQIDFILTSGQGRTETGNSTHEGEEIPMVYSYKTTTRQHAVLKKRL